MFILKLCANVRVPRLNGPLIITVRSKSKWKFRTFAMFPLRNLQTLLLIFYYFQVSIIINHLRIAHDFYQCYRRIRMSLLRQELIRLLHFLRSLNVTSRTSAETTRGIETYAYDSKFSTYLNPARCSPRYLTNVWVEGLNIRTHYTVYLRWGTKKPDEDTSKQSMRYF
jgi:hypothetical protein